MIGIIVPGNKKYTPYIQNYIDVLDNNHLDYRIMSWNKTGMQEEGIDLAFNYTVKDSDRKRMLWGYVRFITECKRYIKNNNINKLIILTAAPAFFLGIHYLKDFDGRFILDIRDDSPFIRRFPKRFKTMCSMAKTVVVSSPEFSPWTGRETVLCHNADLDQLKLHIDDEPATEYKMPIRIVFAGVMIEGQCNTEILNAFKGDNRFEHFYIGRDSSGKQKINEFAKSERMTNVFFEGPYNKNEIIDIYRNKADMINIFRAKTMVNRNALPNKLYEAALSGRPIVVFEHNIAIAEYAKKYSLGIVVPEDQINMVNDYVYNKLRLFDYKKYRDQRVAFLNSVREDMNTFISTVAAFGASET